MENHKQSRGARYDLRRQGHIGGGFNGWILAAMEEVPYYLTKDKEAECQGTCIDYITIALLVKYSLDSGDKIAGILAPNGPSRVFIGSDLSLVLAVLAVTSATDTLHLTISCPCF